MIELLHLRKSYGDLPVITDLSAVFPPIITWICAPSGGGKTTLLRMLLGLERPDGGEMRGRDLRWAAVFQEERLIEGLDARGNLRFLLGKIPQEAGDVLGELGLDVADSRPVRTWSGGMRRRLSLAGALLSPSQALALDEPFTGLDREALEGSLSAIRRRAAGKTVLLASHHPEKEMGEGILYLERGR